MTTDSKNSNAQENQPVFGEMNIARIYVKDLSFEIPNSPDVFKLNWDPKLELQLDTKNQQLDQDVFEVTLRVTATTKIEDKVAYIAEVNQSGIFELRNFPEQQKQHMLGAYCPAILYPYLRQVVANAVQQGGFPPLNLTPINFDGLYEQHLQNQRKTNAEGQALSS